MTARLKLGVIGLGRMGQLYARTLATRAYQTNSIVRIDELQHL